MQLLLLIQRPYGFRLVMYDFRTKLWKQGIRDVESRITRMYVGSRAGVGGSSKWVDWDFWLKRGMFSSLNYRCLGTLFEHTFHCRV